MTYYKERLKLESREEALTHLEHIQYLFTQVPSNKIEQDNGHAIVHDTSFLKHRAYQDESSQECGVCVGVWLDTFFGETDDNEVKWVRGDEYYYCIMEKLGYARDESQDLLFHYAHKRCPLHVFYSLKFEGMPFSIEDWFNHPKKAFKNLIKHIKEEKGLV